MAKSLGLLALILSTGLLACPTCVGKICKKSPPFFSDSFYKPTSKHQIGVKQPLLKKDNQ